MTDKKWVYLFNEVQAGRKDAGDWMACAACWVEKVQLG